MKRIRTILFIGILTLCELPVFGQTNTVEADKWITIYNDVLRQLDINYADTINYERLVTNSIHQLLRQVDPYTVYIPEDKSSDLRLLTTGKYGGIGAMIMQRQGNVYISEPYEGMPAQRNDVRAGDRILEVDGKKTTGLNTSDVSSMLRGTPHTIVTLKLEREGEKKPITVSFEREEIKINPVGYYGIVAPKTGYIFFREFTDGSSDILANAIAEMVKSENITSLVLDLRGNGGGIIDEAVKIMSLFVDKGTEIVSTKGKKSDSNRTYRTPLQPKYKDMQLAVLVDENTASAAEIVSGSLQDLDRAVIIGKRTYGKGLVQSIRPIAYNGHLKVTTSKYYIPSGRCIQAIDYSKRRKDGSVERVPDSLTHEFHTRKGRIVRDGGGIEPDILTEDDSTKVDVTYALYTQNMFFDYATLYRAKHDTIAPMDAFVVDNDDITDFIEFLKEKNFTYETETSKYFREVLELARHEDIDSALVKELKKMQERLTPDYVEAIHQHEEEVKEMMGREIIQRYYFQKGAIAFALKTDKELQRALQELNTDKTE